MSEIKERPIAFTSEMVRAILDGRKTQTRRVVRDPISTHSMILGEPMKHELMVSHRGIWYKPTEWSPYGVTGDRLWVKETWCPVHDSEFGEEDWVDYRATPRYANPGVSHPAGWENAPDDPEALKWRSSRFMPRWASRILLEITDVKVERLQEISLKDINAEGTPATLDLQQRPYGTRRQQFQRLWDSLFAKLGHPWDSNPWVWVIEFKRIEP